MKMIGTWIVALVALLSGLEIASADVKLQLSDVHVCCGACVRGIQNAVKGIDAKVDIDRDGGAVQIEAKDEATAQKVVDAIAAGGFHGTSNNDKVKMKDDSGVTAGKVKRLKLGSVHNCCTGCTNAIRDAFKGVSGVTTDSLTNKATVFVVEGDFDAAEVVKALYAAGFHVKVAN
jgi:copper chaperone CopZ